MILIQVEKIQDERQILVIQKDEQDKLNQRVRELEE